MGWGFLSCHLQVPRHPLNCCSLLFPKHLPEKAKCVGSLFSRLLLPAPQQGNAQGRQAASSGFPSRFLALDSTGWHGHRHCEDISDSPNTGLALTVVLPSHQKIPASVFVPKQRKIKKAPLPGAVRITVWEWTMVNTGSCRKLLIIEAFHFKAQVKSSLAPQGARDLPKGSQAQPPWAEMKGQPSR